jgi:hypothetical protein
VKKGLYAANFGGGQVDITSGKFVFDRRGLPDRKRQDHHPVKGATLIGNGPEAMMRVSMIGNDMALDSGVGTCGKEGQSVPVGVGQPTLRIDGLTVGGTGWLCNRQGIFQVGLRQQDRERLAAMAGNQVPCTQAVGQSVRHAPQYGIAGEIAEPGVEVAEVVDVGNHQAQGLFIPRRSAPWRAERPPAASAGCGSR